MKIAHIAVLGTVAIATALGGAKVMETPRETPHIQPPPVVQPIIVAPEPAKPTPTPSTKPTVTTPKASPTSGNTVTTDPGSR